MDRRSVAPEATEAPATTETHNRKNTMEQFDTIDEWVAAVACGKTQVTEREFDVLLPHMDKGQLFSALTAMRDNQRRAEMIRQRLASLES